MNYWLVGGVLLLAAVLAVLLPRKSIHAELEIAAPPSDVWSVITDTSTYGSWNPIFETVAGTFAEGATMTISMQLEDGSFTPVEAVVEEMIPNEKLHQRAGFPGVLTADHEWRLERTAAGTRVIQHEEYRGVGVLFYDPSYVEVLYAEGLAALKIRLEGDLP